MPLVLMTRSDKDEEDAKKMKEASALEWYHLLCSANANAKAYSEEQLSGITQKNCRQRHCRPICHRGSTFSLKSCRLVM